MQYIQLTLHDPQLEQALSRLANQHQQNLADFIVTVLTDYVQEEQQTALTIPKLDPLQHSQAPTRAFQPPEAEELDAIFSDVDASSSFARTLRQQAWQRHE